MNRTAPSDRSVQMLLRLCIVGAALLFLLSAVWGALPSPASFLRRADEKALAGYEKISLTTPCRPPVLEEYHDRLPESGLTAQVPQTQ